MSVSRMRGTRSGIDPMKIQLDLSLNERDWYTANQLYKALHSRYIQLHQFEEAYSILKDGACRLLEEKEIASGSEIAQLLIQDYQQHHLIPNATNIQVIIDIFSHYDAMDQHPSKISFIRQASTWCDAICPPSIFSCQLHKAFADSFLIAKEYKNAQDHYLRSDDTLSFAKMIHLWQKEGYPSEEDLVFTRSILQYLALGNLKEANNLYQHYMEIAEIGPSQEGNTNVEKKTTQDQTKILFNFCRFILCTLERDALPLFKKLRVSYDTSIKRDPMFDRYLDQIESIFFKSKIASTGNLESLMNNILSSFMGNPSHNQNQNQVLNPIIDSSLDTIASESLHDFMSLPQD